VFQLSLQRGVMADAVWLLFLETSVDRFLENVYIPVDCEFLVAQRSRDDAVQLAEVYKMGQGLPLQRQHFGTWDQNGLLVSTESLVRRRSNFHNYTMTATSFNVSRNEIVIKGSIYNSKTRKNAINIILLNDQCRLVEISCSKSMYRINP